MFRTIRKTPDVPLALVPQYFGSIVYDSRTSQYMPFDIETTILLRRLKSETIETILEEKQDNQTELLIQRFFNHFYKLGFFTIDQRLDGTILDVRFFPDHLVGPLTLHLEIIDSCNLRCKHCFAGVLPRKEQPLTLDELDRLFESMASMGTFRLGLTGGEPLLRPDIFEIIDLAIEHGLSPCLSTNGLLITEEIARELGKRKLAWLNISIEGARSKTNDYIRGNGTFKRLLTRLSILSKYTRFSLAFTIMRRNRIEIKDCVELAYRVGAEAAVFRPLYPVGTACNHPDLMPTFAEYINALDVLSEKKKNNSFEFCNVHPWGPQTRIDSQSIIHENFGCGAGNTVCSVSVSGDVSPCSFLGSSYVAGNIRQTSLEHIWHDSQVFKDIRSLPANDICLNCDSYGICSGGCRARALALSGSINAPDPWCIEQYNKECVSGG